MILYLLFYIIYFIYRSMGAMHMLQQNLYNENNRYLKWTKKNIEKILFYYDFIPVLFFIFVYFLKDKTMVDFLLIASMFIYIYGIYNEFKRNKESQNKLPLKGTNRIKRLFVTILIIYFIPIVIVFLAKNKIIIASILILLAFMLAFVYYVVYFCSVINAPINKLEYLYFLNKAKKKLKQYSNLQVIGITGSYGKTSSKNILNEILSCEYITRCTPKNYNTPYGLMMTINNYLDKFDEIFIAEMGAYVKGRIKNLCDFVKPKYGILTTIGEAHLETFGSRENIQKTKFELIESLPSDGVAVLNMDDPYQVSYELKNKVKVIWIGIDNKEADIYATNIKCSNKGMSFVCHYYGEEITLTTRLLGSHNIYNILSSIALALYMKIDILDIKKAVMGLKATEHRLELKKIGNIYQLDDAYNSNPVGAKGALDVLSMMNGTKVVVTPGMVELGKEEKEANYVFGKKIASSCDYVILIGEKRTKIIYKALIEENFDKENIFILNRVVDAYPIINALKEEKKDIYALFENDLPDIYTEGAKKK